ncbi:MAG: T9SS type A sorting domain-containing protein [bacterium]
MLKPLGSIVLHLFLLLCYIDAFAIRDAPVTTAATVSSCPSSNVVIPVTVTGFTNISALSLRIDYNPTVATYTSFVGNTVLTGLIVNAVSVSPTLSKLMIVWTNTTPKTLPDNDTLVKITMNFINGSTTLVFNNTAGGGGDCEYADETGSPMNDIPTSTYYINGTINTLALGTTGPISGTNPVCAGANGVAYYITPVTNATGYSWSLPPGFTIATGESTNSITTDVSTSASSGNITVTPLNVCGSGSVSPPFPVTVNPLPAPTIDGPVSVCAGTSGLKYRTEQNMTGYIWTVSAGGSITAGQETYEITVTWITTGDQTVSVNYTDANSCTASSSTIKNVTVNPVPVPTIEGDADVCAGSTGVIYSTEASMSGYSWAISSGGGIDSGLGTSQISATWNTAGLQWVSVNYMNNYGCTALTAPEYFVIVSPSPGIPGAITGNADVCRGTNGVIYSIDPIPDVTGYSWEVPFGAEIIDGDNTPEITVNFGSNAESGDITVSGTNSCGSGAPSRLTITVTPSPDTPIIQLNGDTLWSDAITGNQWYYEGNVIPGANSQSYIADFSGWYWSIVNVNGCASDTSNNIYVVITGVVESDDSFVKTFPNPNGGKFTVSISMPVSQSFTLVVYDWLGRKVNNPVEINTYRGFEQVIDLTALPDGVYSLVIKNTEHMIARKVLVKK